LAAWLVLLADKPVANLLLEKNSAEWLADSADKPRRPPTK